jgi:hypothetical protein
MNVVRWVVLWPVLVWLAKAATWLFPPLGFVLWRMRVSKRRHRELVEASR